MIAVFEVVLAALVIMMLTITIVVIKRVARQERESYDQLMRLMGSRQSSIGVTRRSGPAPRIDFRPTTVRRDADDLPRTGRGSRLKMVRKGGDQVGDSDDRRLSQHPGTPAA